MLIKLKRLHLHPSKCGRKIDITSCYFISTVSNEAKNRQRRWVQIFSIKALAWDKAEIIVLVSLTKASAPLRDE